MWDTRACVHTFGDGDTVVMESDLGRDVRHVASIRLASVWAPEMHDVGGPETAAFARKWLEDRTNGLHWPFEVVTLRQLSRSRKADDDSDKMSFTRWLGTIKTIDGTESLGEAITKFVADNGYGGGTGSV